MGAGNGISIISMLAFSPQTFNMCRSKNLGRNSKKLPKFLLQVLGKDCYIFCIHVLVALFCHLSEVQNVRTHIQNVTGQGSKHNESRLVEKDGKGL